MSSIFESTKELITPQYIEEASAALGEDESNIATATLSAVPTFLASLIAKGDDPYVELALKQAGNLYYKMVENGSGRFSTDNNPNTQGLGIGILSTVLCEKLNKITALISSISGISTRSANKLLASISSLIGSFLGNKLNSENINLARLINQLSSEQNDMSNTAPSGLTAILSLTPHDYNDQQNSHKRCAWIRKFFCIII